MGRCYFFFKGSIFLPVEGGGGGRKKKGKNRIFYVSRDLLSFFLFFFLLRVRSILVPHDRVYIIPSSPFDPVSGMQCMSSACDELCIHEHGHDSTPSVHLSPDEGQYFGSLHIPPCFCLTHPFSFARFGFRLAVTPTYVEDDQSFGHRGRWNLLRNDSQCMGLVFLYT